MTGVQTCALPISEENISRLVNNDPKTFSGIYIGGGNTPYLLKKLKETGFWDFLKKAIDMNIPIYGSSAGAVIFGKTINPALPYDKNEVRLKDLKGFNILNGIEISCHYSENEKQIVQDLIEENKIEKLIALTEKNGLFITESSITLIGKEEGFLFEKGKIRKVSVGEKIKI